MRNRKQEVFLLFDSEGTKRRVPIEKNLRKLTPKQPLTNKKTKTMKTLKKLTAMKRILILCLFCFILTLANGQIKILPSNQVVLGWYPAYGNSQNTFGGYTHTFYYKTSPPDVESIFHIRLSTFDGANLGCNFGKVTFWDTPSGYQNIYAKAYTTASDRNLKKNITPLTNLTQKVLSLKPVTFDYIKNPDATKRPNGRLDLKEIGFIAQDVELILPEVIRIDSDGNRLINYDALIPVLAGAFQEMHARIEALEKQLNAK